MSDGIEEIRGKSLLIRFEGQRCIHSRQCVLGRPDVFVPNADGEWIHPDAAPAETVAALAHACPSGAISYERLDGGPSEGPPLVNVARVRENGPLALHADLEVEGHGSMLRATLCRCGASKNKPFCDGSHVAAGFQATGEPPAVGAPALAQRDGKLQVTPRPDGPLIFSGNLELVSGTGRSVGHGRKAALCRCGRSDNKPYCDGTHKKIGFKSG